MLMDRGVLVRWNDEKGFGFIQPEKNAAQDVFIHISVLKKMARKPIVGDSILFQTEVQNDGKRKAVIASIEGVAVVAASATTRSHSHIQSRNENFNNKNKAHYHSPRKSSFNTIIPLLIIVAIVIFGFKQYQEFNEAPAIDEVPVLTNEDTQPMPMYETKARTQATATPSFQCEAGKTHCSHMSSCAEATFYIQNCPNTQMDGDDDGIPCERQWCS
ncbi:excalibur calcium-binding domain-containing protein [Shewanella sp. SW36]|uniref:excalibur calcium-binding domain-containing protein n=1 Tax=Shewanella TaxID=22 RepID=UPI0021DA6778|nr:MULTISPECIES: excalibur calcium-binding domain-containing protein [unclassified Shewanella]GCF89719.1 cold-shock protein [Shewanella sp. M-Br]MCU7977492.1 excalibur calcium-binding domain-containing protein [Shewanella sp. SW36]MCU7992749.1 excalibur calcium-binding domain-containing protein [Shewanella sp. SW1]MCU8000261.1 excalibur calcium-binding domain-containing protein [Shewanella sp. SM95]MCU8016022.1 excalibur calcium-binding domain-containing protein [Shewanella sp. SM72]